jgi:hypothetical protein
VCGPSIGTLPAQIEPLARWPDGSVKWMRVDVLPPPGSGGAADWCLTLGIEDRANRVGTALRLDQRADAHVVVTGTHRFTIPADQMRPFATVGVSNAISIGADVALQSEFVLVDRRGRPHIPNVDQWRVESAGPIRITLAADGHIPGFPGLRLRLRESFYAGTGLVRFEVTLHNSRRARHRGGLWDLGDPGSVLFEEFAFQLSLPGGMHHDVGWSTDPSADCGLARCAEFNLYQDSSGGQNWNSPNHVNRDGRVACRYRGFRVQVDGRQDSGQHALPTVCVAAEPFSVAVAYPEFWQQFPKAIAVERGRLRIGLFPRECDDLFELQGGEQKCHVFWLQFADRESHDPTAECRSLQWAHQPICVRPTAEWCDATGVLPELVLPAARSRESLERLLDEAIDGPRSLASNRERVDEYGWRNYGDVFADHELLYYRGPRPLISHYNNQFDMLRGLLIQYLRTGDRRWWQWGDALARHVVDIDMYHTTKDKAAYNGGLFWFTDHYLHAHTSTHRTYSKTNCTGRKGSYGGGPSPEHNFTSGLALHYCLTGNLASRDAVLSLAGWVIAMDDGRRTPLGLVDESPTGCASGRIHRNRAAGRAAGNSVNALLDAWVLTFECRYLEFAEMLIRRCIHPCDEVDARGLLDVEDNWSYTVFLASLSKYLDCKSEAGQFDGMFDYGRASLVHYARWMLDNERPYFDQFDALEFPTEAWAAQELRKANVLRLAARYVDEPLRTRLYDRGDELADRGWSDLMRFETRSTARSIAIVMNEGHVDCILRSRAMEPMRPLASGVDFDEPMEFVPQRQRVKRSASHPAGMFVLACRLLNPNRWLRYLHNGSDRPNRMN